MEIVVAVCLALLIRRYVCILVWVKGNSMRDTLQNREVLLAVRRPIHRKLLRFDVVICCYPGRRERFVKRIVALPGEQIAIQEGVLHIDGAAVEENFPQRTRLMNMQERVVDAGCYFVMGDNRAVSRDSRRVGAIADGKIEAVVKYVVWPPNKIRKVR